MMTTSRSLTGPSACHPGPVRCAQGKLREGSLQLDSQANTGDLRGLWPLRMTVPGFFCPLIVLTTLAGGVGTSYAVERVWEKQFPLSPGGRVSIENVQGGIWVEGWDQSQVEATVAMHSTAPTDRLDDVQVAVEARRGSLAFHTLYPSDLEVPVRVDYHLRVPRQVRLEELSTLEGGVAVRDVEGPVHARSLHGDIAGINLGGALAARALTGSIRVTLRSLPCPDEMVKLETVSGDVILQLPPRANADLELATVSGRILGHYAFQASSVPGDATRRVHLGEGGVVVKLRTVRGDIQLAQRPEEL